MAKAEMQPALVRLVWSGEKFVTPADGQKPDLEAKFGKTDRILKFAFPLGDAKPTGVLFVGRSGRVHVADFSRYPEAIQAVMVFHGAKQKLGDEYADLDNEDDCFEAMIALDGRLAEGKWEAERQGFAGISVLMRAIMKVFNLSEEQAREFLKPLTKAEKDALRVDPEIKPTIDEIERERGKKVDSAPLIERLKKANDQPPQQ